jgi:hypothetical protein
MLKSPPERRSGLSIGATAVRSRKNAPCILAAVDWCRTGAIRRRSTLISLGRSTPQSQRIGTVRPNVPEHQFKAEIQGHFSITQEGKKLPNYSARSNYDDYAIGDGQGNRDGRLGIKLGQVKGLEVIEAFRDDRHEPEPKDELDSPEITGKTEAIDISADTDKEQGIMAEPKQAAMKRPGLYADDLERMHTLMSQRNVKGTAAEVFNALLDAFVEETSTTQKQQIETVGGLTQTLNWFTERISQVEQERDQLRAECDRFQSQQQSQQGEPEQVSQLKARNAQLEQELKQTQAQLNGIQQLLGGGVQQPVAPPPRAETVPVPPPSAQAPTGNSKEPGRPGKSNQH